MPRAAQRVDGAFDVAGADEHVVHGPSRTVPAGTEWAAHTADNSVGVRVIEVKAPWFTQSGSVSPGGHRQMAYSSGKTSSSSVRITEGGAAAPPR